MPVTVKNIFSSLKVLNYRIWFFGSIISNTGTNLQRTAQDWLVIAILTDGNALSLGIIMALQYAPLVILAPVAGMICDKVSVKIILFITQITQGALATFLGFLILFGHVQMWNVQLFALCLGIISAFDSTARQVFVGELVGRDNIVNAVSLNSLSFNLGRILGPSLSGVLIAVIGVDWAFLINGMSFIFVIVSMTFIRRKRMFFKQRASKDDNNLLDVFRYIKARPRYVALFMILLMMSAFVFNFQIYLSKIVLDIFDNGSALYGLFVSLVSVGAVIGALAIASRTKILLSSIIAFIAACGVFLILSATVTSIAAYGLVMIIIGLFMQMAATSSNSYAQLNSDEYIRGRVMSLVMAVFFGGTPLGALLVGFLSDTFGIRFSLIFAGSFVVVVSALVFLWLLFKQSLKIKLHRRHEKIEDAYHELNLPFSFRITIEDA
jgi:MFS family permease